MKIIQIIILLFFYVQVSFSQTNSMGYQLKFDLLVGNSKHGSELMNFPIGYSDAAISPTLQKSSLGYEVSISALKVLSRRFSLGIAVSVSKFGFRESGNELSFWTGEISDYKLDREFVTFGFGPIIGIDVLKNEVNKLSIYSGIRCEEFISTKNLFLWQGRGNRTKYASSLSMSYGHRISDTCYLSAGISSTIALNAFFNDIHYKPFRYGVTVGMEYSLN